jgi:hypothetical protein
MPVRIRQAILNNPVQNCALPFYRDDNDNPCLKT